MKLTASIVGALVMTALVAGTQPCAGVGGWGPGEKVTLTGCAVKGNGDGDGFLLANSVEQTTVDHCADPGRFDGQLDDDQRNEAGPGSLLARR